MRYGWEHPETARRYAAFCAAPTRYQFANDALARALILPSGARVLDFAAGQGHTAEAVLRACAPAAVVCVEPAVAMRELGRERLADERVSWSSVLPPDRGFDAVVCGAGLWQVPDFVRVTEALSARLAPDGVFAFSIPSLYLGRPDRPGGGVDPDLSGFWAHLAAGRTTEAPPVVASPAQLLEALRALGFELSTVEHEYRLTVTELAAWLRIPVLTDALFPELTVAARDPRIDAALRAADASSFRWEGWSIVTASAFRSRRAE